MASSRVKELPHIRNGPFHMFCCGYRLSYELGRDGDTDGPRKPNYWQTRLEGQNPGDYLVVLETLTNANALQSSYRSFNVSIPASVTSVDLTFTWSQVIAGLHNFPVKE